MEVLELLAPPPEQHCGTGFGERQMIASGREHGRLYLEAGLQVCLLGRQWDFLDHSAVVEPGSFASREVKTEG